MASSHLPAGFMNKKLFRHKLPVEMELTQEEAKSEPILKRPSWWSRLKTFSHDVLGVVGLRKEKK